MPSFSVYPVVARQFGSIHELLWLVMKPQALIRSIAVCGGVLATVGDETSCGQLLSLRVSLGVSLLDGLLDGLLDSRFSFSVSFGLFGCLFGASHGHR